MTPPSPEAVLRAAGGTRERQDWLGPEPPEAEAEAPRFWLKFDTSNRELVDLTQ